MTPAGPAVSVVVPARNEEADLGRCLAALGASDMALDEVEVIVVDGGSEDATVEVARAELARHPFARAVVVDNAAAGGGISSNLNAGLAAARGDLLVRVDARSLVPADYVRTCVEVLRGRPDVAVVGGAQVAVARSGSTGDRGIARALNNRWGMGLSRYRRGAASGPADTVYLGAFRTAQLRAAGGWDARLEVNEDFELNRRMAQQGTVWFADRLVVGYLPRASLGELFRQYHRFGRWKTRYWRLTGDRPQRRQVVLLATPIVPLAAVAMTARSGRMRRWLAVLGVLGAVAVEAGGSRGAGRGSPGEHAVAVAALATTSVAWLSGVYRELVAGR